MVISRMARWVLAMAISIAAMAGAALAQGKTTTLYVAPDLIETGVIKFMMPRFMLKHGVRVTLVEDASAGAAALVEDGQRAVFSKDGVTYGLTVSNADDVHMATFAEWLTGEVGQRTVLTYKRDGAEIFAPPVVTEAAVEATVFDGDATRGADLALTACGRCHVVGDANRMSGIGSTPSFAVLRSLADWEERFAAFYALNPHPAFTVIPDLTEPFDETRPSPISPVTLSLEELENILAYAATVVPADLGKPIAHQ